VPEGPVKTLLRTWGLLSAAVQNPLSNDAIMADFLTVLGIVLFGLAALGLIKLFERV